MMKYLLAVLLAVPATALAEIDLAAEFAAGKSIIEVAEMAVDEDLEPDFVTEQFIELGQTPARSAFAVTRAYSRCEATLSSVWTATKLAPQEAEHIVTSIAGLQDCGCSGQDNWGRLRLEGRVRLPDFTQPIELAQACTCITAAVQAAIGAAPDRSDLIVRAAAEASHPPSAYVADSVGDRDFDEVPELNNARIQAEPLVMQRNVDVCRTDTDELDDFDPTKEWSARDGNDFSHLGRYEFNCDDDDELDTVEEHEFNELMISEFRADPNGHGYVEIFNGTGEPVDLTTTDYRLTVYHQGVTERAQSIRLQGVVPNAGTYIIAATGSHDSILARADQVIPALSVISGDVMTLHPGFTTENCDCSEAVVASALSGKVFEPNPDDPDAEEQARLEAEALSRQVKAKVQRMYGEIEQVAPGYVVDAIGRVDYEEDEMDEEMLDPLLRRMSETCSGDANELDPFEEVGRVWWAGEQPEYDNAGFHAANCREDNVDIVLSEYIDGEEERDAVEIHNPTPADIDLKEGGYMIELYQPGDSSPSRSIRLDGTIASRQSLLIADEDAEEELEEDPHMAVADLDLSGSSAVVLRKLMVPNSLSCTRPIALAADVLIPDVVFFLQPPTNPLPPGDKDPIPPIVIIDPIASPN